MKKKLFQGAAVAAISVFIAAGTPAQAEGNSGFYFGGHLGGGSADFDGFLGQSDPLVVFNNLDINGFAGGLQLGYLLPLGMDLGGMGQLVTGVEGDVTFTDWADNYNGDPALTTQGIRGVVDLLASVRAILGVNVDNWLFYTTGGIAFADAHAKAHYNGTVEKVQLNDTGFVFGGGVRYQVTELVSVRVEGLYYFFSDRETFSDPPGTNGGFAKLDGAYVIRGGISFSLDQLMSDLSN